LPHGDQVAADPAVRLGERDRLLGVVEAVQVHFRRVDRDRDAAEFAEFTELFRGELGLRGAAAADHVHLAHLARAQRGEDRLRHVGLRQLLRVAGDDAGHVHGHVADADHGHRLGIKHERVHVHVGVAAVPVDEVGGGVAAGQVLAVDAEPAVAHRARRVHHGVVGGEQVLAGHVFAEPDPAEERDVRAFQDAPQVVGH
jgi:hypothetical protein